MKHLAPFAMVTFAALMLTGCEVVGGIFKAGVWVGVVLVVLVIAIIVWLFSRSRA
jgi:hypothetical protein